MAKQEIRTTQTNVHTPDANGQQLEQTFTVEDSFLPSPVELKAYLEINPAIVELLIKASKEEQVHRHYMDRQKIKTINRDSRSVHIINLTGMFLAFLVMITGMALSAYLIYKGMDITGTMFGGATIIMAVFAFLKQAKKK